MIPFDILELLLFLLKQKYKEQNLKDFLDPEFSMYTIVWKKVRRCLMSHLGNRLNKVELFVKF